MSPVTIAWTRRASRPSTKRSSCRRSAAWSAGGRASAQVEACSLKVLDGSWRGSGKGADPRKVANPRESAGAVVQAPVCSDVRAVRLHGQRDEGGVVEGETELTPQTARFRSGVAGGATMKGSSSRVCRAIVVDDISGVPPADPLPLQLLEGSESLLPGAPVPLAFGEQCPECLSGQLAARAALSLGSQVDLLQEFLWKRDHDLGHRAWLPGAA